MFYVYEHWRPDKNLPFYVGKGKAGRAWNFVRRNKHHKAIVAFLLRTGLSAETIARLSAAQTGKKPSGATLEKMRIASHKRWSKPEERAKASLASLAYYEKERVKA